MSALRAGRGNLSPVALVRFGERCVRGSRASSVPPADRESISKRETRFRLVRLRLSRAAQPNRLRWPSRFWREVQPSSYGNNWGKPCHLARLPIDLAVWDRTGRRVRLVRSGVPQSGIAGDFSPRFERLIDITYVRLRPAWAILGGGPRWPLQRSRNSLGQGDGLFHRWMKPKREGCGRAAAG
jgi:hypothetical protein